jgi:hypothetical protein
MRFELLFLRWLVVIALIAVGLGYAWSLRQGSGAPQYQKVVLLQGASSFGLPLAGIAVDPERREVYGLLGRPGKDVPPDFFILWKGKEGQSYGATFSSEDNALSGLCEILPHGDLRTLHDFRTAEVSSHAAPPGRDPSEILRPIVRALPPDLDLPGRQPIAQEKLTGAAE